MLITLATFAPANCCFPTRFATSVQFRLVSFTRAHGAAACVAVRGLPRSRSRSATADVRHTSGTTGKAGLSFLLYQAAAA